jgi:putative ABC transport system permease protein
MNRQTLARWLEQAPTASGSHLSVDAASIDDVQQALKRAPLAAGVTSPDVMLRRFEESMAESIYTSLLIVSAFAAVIAVGVIYNGARIGLSERGRELASLRVLGFTQREISVILLGEQAVVTGLAIPAGYALGLLYCFVWIGSLNSEGYRIPIVFAAPTFVWAGAIIVCIAALAGLVVRRRLAHLDLIAVLKTRE